MVEQLVDARLKCLHKKIMLSLLRAVEFLKFWHSINKLHKILYSFVSQNAIRNGNKQTSSVSDWLNSEEVNEASLIACEELHRLILPRFVCKF